jgi:hypothetical protein
VIFYVDLQEWVRSRWYWFTFTMSGDVYVSIQEQFSVAKFDQMWYLTRMSEVQMVLTHLHAVCWYVGLARTIYIRCIYGSFGRAPNIRSYTVYIYGSGQPYWYVHLRIVWLLCDLLPAATQCIHLWLVPPILYIVCDLCHPYYILSVIYATHIIYYLWFVPPKQ